MFQLYLSSSDPNGISSRSLRTYCCSCIRKFYLKSSVHHRAVRISLSRQLRRSILIDFSPSLKSMRNVCISICHKFDTTISICCFIMFGQCRFSIWRRSSITCAIFIRRLSRSGVNMEFLWKILVNKITKRVLS